MEKGVCPKKKPIKLFCLLFALMFITTSCQKKRDKSLREAAVAGDINRVRLLISKGANVNASDKWGQTPLQYTVRSGYYEVADLLLAKGAKVPDDLDVVAYVGDLNRAKRLIENGADINPPYSSVAYSPYAPLHHTAYAGRREVAELLIAKGANVNWKNTADRTPLHVSAAKGQTHIVELLIANGADIDPKDKIDFTPLHLAVESGHRDVVEVLIANKANVNAEGDMGCPLHLAAERGQKDMVGLLIAKGANVNARAVAFLTPLHLAAAGGHRDVAEMLIAMGADINAKDNFMGYTPLHWAVSKDHVDTVKILIDKGANVNSKAIYYNMTPLGLASNKEIAELLRKHGGKE